jgi:hypothetical protein
MFMARIEGEHGHARKAKGQSREARSMQTCRKAWCGGLVGLAVVLLIYCYPAVRARYSFGKTAVPPMFAADLPLYLNLGLSTRVGQEFLNPYYLVWVPLNAAGYLKFRLAPEAFAGFATLLHGHLPEALIIWNVAWWAILGLCATWLFARFLPKGSASLTAFGVMLLMLFNFGVFKNLVLAWVHLPSISGFESLELPYMRAFVPVIPIALLIVYLALQIDTSLGRNSVLRWGAMALVQYVALRIFPYATVMMVGITAVSLVGELFGGESSGQESLGEDSFGEEKRTRWATVVVYGLVCGVADGAFALRGPLQFYGSRSSMFVFQPRLLLHLIGGNWLLLCLLVVAVGFSQSMAAPVKWPLVGLGLTNLILMLGDVMVPARTILLSHHAGYFLHTSVTILLAFLVATRLGDPGNQVGVNVLRVATVFLIANGTLLTIGTYRNYFPENQEQAEFAKAIAGYGPGVLVIARSKNVDDPCGWVNLLIRTEVLYCTDAETMLTAEQNLEIQRPRQAIYLFLTGHDTASLQQVLAGTSRHDLMYQLGYWAEATSLSPAEQEDGVREIRRDLLPHLEAVEQQGPSTREFFRSFAKIVVVDNQDEPVFMASRLACFLKLTSEHYAGHLRVSEYTAR